MKDGFEHIYQTTFLSNLFEMKQTVELKIRFNETNPTKTLMLAHLSRRCNSNEKNGLHILKNPSIICPK